MLPILLMAVLLVALTVAVHAAGLAALLKALLPLLSQPAAGFFFAVVSTMYGPRLGSVPK